MSDMQTQARICPECHDDHFEGRPCNPEFLKMDIKRLQTALAEEKAKNAEMMEDIELLESLRDIITKSNISLSQACSKERIERLALLETLRLQKEVVEAARKIAPDRLTFNSSPTLHGILLEALKQLDAHQEKMKGEG